MRHEGRPLPSNVSSSLFSLSFFFLPTFSLLFHRKLHSLHLINDINGPCSPAVAIAETVTWVVPLSPSSVSFFPLTPNMYFPVSASVFLSGECMKKRVGDSFSPFFIILTRERQSQFETRARTWMREWPFVPLSQGRWSHNMFLPSLQSSCRLDGDS